MKSLQGLLVVLGLFSAATVMIGAEPVKEDKKGDPRVFELRTYYVAPGKMEALQARFRDHTNKLLAKHGMTLIGFWTPTDPDESDKKLIYLVAHPSQEAAKKNWKEFGADPEWKAAKEASEKDGKLVDKVESVYLKPTEFSALK